MRTYEIRFERRGSWTVCDVRTGETATVDGTPCTNLDVVEALGVAEGLNALEAQKADSTIH